MATASNRLIPSSRPALTEPLSVVVVGNEVVILGPGHLHGVLSLEAAQATVRRLAEAIEQAARQRAAPI